jgi:DNA-binding CsgD family transcriptional regulator
MTAPSRALYRPKSRSCPRGYGDPMRRPAVRVSEQGVAAICEISAAATSGAPVDERAEAIIERLRELIPIEAAAASAIDPVTGRQRLLVNAGYTPRLVDHVSSPAYHAEVVEPYALPRRGWPVRQRELGIDPLSLTCVSDYFQPEGLTEGLLSALVTKDGRHVGVLDISVSDERHPSDEACAVIGHLAPMLANLTDPLQSARTLAATLDREARAVAILPSGDAFVLHGELAPDEALLEETVEAVVPARPTAAFLWPRSEGGWHACRALRCRDGVTVLLVRDSPDVHRLTLRELEVLACVVEGRSNESIAQQLWITHRTARTHVEHILAKLEVATRAGAVARATREGLLLPPRAIALLR